MNIKIKIKKTWGQELEYDRVMTFGFCKDIYLPYTELRAAFQVSDDVKGDWCEISLLIDGKTLHHGLVDTLDCYIMNGERICSLTSKSFTSLLIRNQIELGMYPNVSLNTLMSGFYSIPNVTHENSSDTGNYIYIRKNATMWDGIVNLAYKLKGTHPYIRGTNEVRISYVQSPEDFSFSDGEIVRSGVRYDNTRLTSGFHMQNIAGQYGDFDLTDYEVIGNKIVRNKYFDLDRQFLYNPQEALQFRQKFDRRGWRQQYCRYSGYRGEDLTDMFSFTGFNGRRITYVSVTGNQNGIFTELAGYEDGFING